MNREQKVMKLAEERGFVVQKVDDLYLVRPASARGFTDATGYTLDQVEAMFGGPDEILDLRD